MRLLIYELKKNVFRVSLFLLLVAFLGIDIYKIHENIRLFGSRPPYEEGGIFEEFKGELTLQKIQEALDYQKKMSAVIASGSFSTDTPSDEFFDGYAFGDYNNINYIVEIYDGLYHYPQEIEAIKARADENIAFYTGKSDYEVNKNNLIKSLYSGRKITVFGRYNTFELYFDYEFSSLLIIVLMVFAFSAAFASEKVTGTNKIMISCGQARSVFWAKHLSMYLFIFVITVLFSVTDLMIFGSVYGLEYIEQPLYAMEGYRYAPFAVTVLGAVLLSMLGKVIAFIFVGEVIMLISTFFKNIGACIAVCLAGILGIILISERLPESISPISLVNAETQLQSFSTVNIFSLAIPAPLVTIIISIALTVIINIICYIRAFPRIKIGGAT